MYVVRTRILTSGAASASSGQLGRLLHTGLEGTADGTTLVMVHHFSQVKS